MGKLDKIKEELNYLKVWLGVFIVIAVSIISWLSEHLTNDIRSYLAVNILIVLSIAIFISHRKIISKINETEEL